MKINKGWLLYIFILLVIFFFVAEKIACLKYEKSYLAVNVQPDKTFHHLLPPYTKGSMSSQGDFEDTYLTNNRGMRGPKDYAYAKSQSTFRIAVMGDSFTFGIGVKAEENYSSVLQRLLDQSAPGRYEVLNFGVSSFSPVLEYVYLKKEVIKYKPDLLILALDVGDIHDDYFYEQNLVYAPNGEIIACDPYMRGGRPDVWKILKKHSMLLTMVDEKVIESIRKANEIGIFRYFQNKKNKIRNKTIILTDPDLDNAYFDRFIFTRQGKNPTIVKKHWQRTAKYLAMIKKVCDENGIRFLLTSYPCGQDVGERQWAKGREYWGFLPGKVYDPGFAFSLIGAFSKENNIDFVSLLEPMRQNNHKTLYYNNDGHWTPDGQSVAAYTIYQSEAFRRHAGLK